MKTFYVTTPIFYASGDPHIGHAYTCLLADMVARYYRMTGRPVCFLTGTDEHGQKIAQKAKEAGVEPQAFVDEKAARFEALCDALTISNDIFYRTTSPQHRASVEAFWKAVKDAGYIYKKAYEGLYCVGCEAFKMEKDLVNGLCPDHQVAPEPYAQENYFFRLTAFEDQLKALFAERPDFVVPSSRANEMKQILAEGLEDISISRSREMLTWGIPVPGDEDQVIYVWFDARINYLGATGYGWDEARVQERWPADIHLMAKEITRFHALLWPAMLMAAGVEVPQQIAAHGWITVEGQKMSKSIGNVIDPFELTQRYGTEAVRYFFGRETSFSNDGDFSRARFEERYVKELANDLGNLLNRAVAMTERYLEGVVPARAEYTVASIWTRYRSTMESLEFARALEAAWELVNAMNKFIDETEPWKLAKQEDLKPLQDVLYILLEALRHLGWMLMPFLPETAPRIFEQIGTSFEEQAQQALADAAQWGGLKPGAVVKKGDTLFPRERVSEI